MDEREYQERLRNGTLPVIESGTPPHFIKPKNTTVLYGESPLAQYRNKSIKLPCGCDVKDVPQWTEALYHMMHPESCPTLTSKEIK